MRILPLVAAAWLPCLLGGPASAAWQEPDELRSALQRLDHAPPAEIDSALDGLVSLGPPAALLAAEELERVGPRGRRLRVRVVLRAGDAECVPLALAALDDPDPAVRRDLVAFLSRRDLEQASLAERLEALETVARDDPVPGVRIEGLAGLSGIPEEEGARRLDRLIDRLPGGERVAAARALAGHPDARALIVDRVQRGFTIGRERRTPEDVVAVLLETAYGHALAELPGGGTTEIDLLPLVLGALHPSPSVREASTTARERLVGRLRFLGEGERADRILGELLGQGLDDRRIHLERLDLRLSALGDAEGALASARAIRESSRRLESLEDRMWHFRGAYLEGIALLGLDRVDEAARALDQAEAVIEGLRKGRLEALETGLAPEMLARWAPKRAAVEQGVNLVHLGQATQRVLAGAGADDAELLRRMLRVHRGSLEQQLSLARAGPLAGWTGSVDGLLDNSMSPITLLFAGARLPVWDDQPRLDRLAIFYRALAAVAPGELPGFTPVAVPEPSMGDPALDPRRVELLLAIHAELESGLRTRLRSLPPDDPQWNLLRDLWRQQLIARQRIAERGGPDPDDLRTPSDAVLDLMHALLDEGHADRAQLLALAALGREEEVEDDPGRTRKVAAATDEELKARIEMALGAALTDDDRPREAEEELRRSLDRLEALEADMATRGTLSLARGRIETLRASAMVSLAVNANVRQQDQEAALDWFERAYALRQDDFMRVLLACYRARAGQEAEAREVMRETPISPGNYYNAACTWALLGEPDLALDYLQREFSENHFSARSLSHQQEWAEADPDLEALRGHPRFLRLLEMEWKPRERR